MAIKPDVASAAFWIGFVTPFALTTWFVPAVLWRAWVLMKLWAWFVVPAFGVAPLHLVYAFGLCIIANSFRAMPQPEKDPCSAFFAMGFAFVGPFITLGLGWIGSLFV